MTWRRYHDSVEDDSAGEAAEEVTARTERVTDEALVDAVPLPEGNPAEEKSVSSVPEDDSQEATGPGEHLLAKRVRVPLAFFTIIMLVIVARLALWQLPIDEKAGSVPVAEAAEPSRGRIVDRNGLLMATDDFVYDVYVRPSDIRTANIGQSIMISLTEILDEPPEMIDQDLAPEKNLVILSREANTDQCQQIQSQLQKPEMVWCEMKRVRAYPQGSVAAHLLGFTNYKRQGIYGLEASYDRWLRSDGDWPTTGFPTTPVAIPDPWKMYLPSPAGHDLVLYLDAPLQYMVETRLREAVANYQAEAGTIIIMDPRSGGVLAMANYPTFDPNHYSDVSAETWVNPAVDEIYEPGSVFKLVTMAAALDSGRITPDTPFTDSGSLEVAGRTIHNAEEQAYGLVTATEALAHSINVVSARISMDMGPEVFYGYVRRFGFGKMTEVDLNSESAGILKERGRSADWSIFDQATNSFGQGISVTALQMVNAVAAIANKGVLLQPRIVHGMVSDGQVYYLPPHIIARPIKAETARKLTEMMVYTVENSSYKGLVPGYTVAGKTGTAEIPTATGYTSPETITSFIAFLPADDPQLVIMVKLDKPQYSRWAEQVAVPVLGEVAQDAVRILAINPQ